LFLLSSSYVGSQYLRKTGIKPARDDIPLDYYKFWPKFSHFPLESTQSLIKTSSCVTVILEINSKNDATWEIARLQSPSYIGLLYFHLGGSSLGYHERPSTQKDGYRTWEHHGAISQIKSGTKSENFTVISHTKIEWSCPRWVLQSFACCPHLQNHQAFISGVTKMRIRSSK
jgi:hypothetical protein